ncbi:MAG: hypothetical protein AAF968_14080, partial [Pseudomonadota bacterium]
MLLGLWLALAPRPAAAQADGASAQADGASGRDGEAEAARTLDEAEERRRDSLLPKIDIYFPEGE